MQRYLGLAAHKKKNWVVINLRSSTFMQLKFYADIDININNALINV